MVIFISCHPSKTDASNAECEMKPRVLPIVCAVVMSFLTDGST